MSKLIGKQTQIRFLSILMSFGYTYYKLRDLYFFINAFMYIIKITKHIFEKIDFYVFFKRVTSKQEEIYMFL